jgi:hypothetical protein
MSPLVVGRMVTPLAVALVVAPVLLALRDRVGLGRILRTLLLVLAVGNIALVGTLWTRQVSFPLDLDLMEGTILQHVQRAAAGLSMRVPL